MRAHELVVGDYYKAKVSGKIVAVRLLSIRKTSWYSPLARNLTRYDVESLKTGRKLTFRSAARFIGPFELGTHPVSTMRRGTPNGE